MSGVPTKRRGSFDDSGEEGYYSNPKHQNNCLSCIKEQSPQTHVYCRGVRLLSDLLETPSFIVVVFNSCLVFQKPYRSLMYCSNHTVPCCVVQALPFIVVLFKLFIVLMFRLVYQFLSDGAIICASVLGCSKCLERPKLLLVLLFLCVILIIHCIPGTSLRLHSKGCIWLRGYGLGSKSQNPITILGSIFCANKFEGSYNSRLQLCMTAPDC